MKLNKIFAACMLIAAVVLTACEPPVPPTPNPGPGPDGQDTTVVTPPTPEGEAPDTTGWNIPAECLTVAEANALCQSLEDNAKTGTKYYVKGWIKKLASKHAEGIASYGNALFYMVDTKDAQEDFYAYQVYGLNGQKITNPDGVAEGDYVVVYGELTKYVSDYGTTLETVGRGAAYIWKSTNKALGEAGGGNSGNTGTTPSAPDVPNVDIPAGAIVFDGDTDKGNATETAAAYTITKDGVTLAVSQGRLGTYNNETHYRIYKNQTLTVTSTAGNIKEIIFICTANGTAQYGPGCFTASAGVYEPGTNAVGTWTGSASEVVFTATTDQVRATQIAVVVE